MRTLLYVPLLVGLLVLQVKLADVVDHPPDLLLLAVLVVASRSGERTGLFFGAASGLLLDLFSGGLIGPQILAKGITGFFSASARGLFARKARALLGLAFLFLVVLHALILEGVYLLFIPPGPLKVMNVLQQAVLLSLLWMVVDRIWTPALTDELPT